jgi:hypothetical protein
MDEKRMILVSAAVCLLAASCASASYAAGAPLEAHPAAPVETVVAAECQREHVYVFLLNGLDPFFFCQFNKMPDYVKSLGYEHVYFGQMTSKSKFLDEIREIRANDPCARIALLGFSTGANTACSMSHILDKEGCHLDLLIYLGGCYIYNRDSSRPENALKIVNIRDSGLVTVSGGLLRGEDVDGAENVKIPGVTFHIMTPINSVTQDTLARELGALARSVPALQPAQTKPTAHTDAARR